ncbi:794_t:CDS:2 [Entrophospora sp. SA101]|nr:794_t:CDS:2 [Entrophospora sp. SA101]
MTNVVELLVTFNDVDVDDIEGLLVILLIDEVVIFRSILGLTGLIACVAVARPRSLVETIFCVVVARFSLHCEAKFLLRG